MDRLRLQNCLPLLRLRMHSLISRIHGRNDCSSKRQIFSLVMLLAGFGLLGYSFTQYARMYCAQQNLARRWREENEAARRSRPSPAKLADQQPNAARDACSRRRTTQESRR